MGGQVKAIDTVKQKDLYEVLGVPKTATFDELKAAYRKLALRHHPDKSPSHEKEAAALKFQELTASYTVLSDPVKRAKYDSQGLAALEPNELEVAIDSSSLGMFSTFAAAMFTKLGVPLKTSVPSSVIEQAYDGRFSPKRMRLDESFVDKAEKGQAQFYEMELSQKDIDNGFVIGAHSKIGSKFKILLFEQTGENRWELSDQEDSESIGGNVCLASLFFTPSRPYTIAPKNTLEAARNPEQQLFVTLESLAQREELRAKPGRCVFAVYNDNWIKRAQYTVSLVPQSKAVAKVAFSEMRSAEDNLLDLQSSIRQFQSEYRAAQEKWRAAVKKHENLSHDVEVQLASRQQAHYKLLTE